MSRSGVRMTDPKNKTESKSVIKVLVSGDPGNRTFKYSGGEPGKEDDAYDEISKLPLSARAINRLRSAGITSLSELLSLSEAELMRIYKMGIKTCREITEYIDSAALRPVGRVKTHRLQGIDKENMSIPISALKNIGLSHDGIEHLMGNGYETVGDLCEGLLSTQEYTAARPAEKYLSMSVLARFKHDLNSLKDSAKYCVINRCNGATLQEIGKNMGVTRERVRQIILNACRRLRQPADLTASILFSSSFFTFDFSSLKELFGDDQMALCCKLVLQESDYVRFFKFSDRFVCSDICPQDADQRLRDCMSELVGDGFNFSDNLANIESELKKQSLSFFDFEDVMNYLISNGYYFFGDYVMKGKQSYSNVCYDAIRKYFPFDIKLDSYDDNDDMKRLRTIIRKHYQGLDLPPANKALTSAITRDSLKMILSGRGRYCPIEKVNFSVELFEDVRNYILQSDQTSFYYYEVYSHFKERFLAETNINNFYFLHGMLKYMFSSEFTFERDLFIKNNSERHDVNDRLCQILKQNGKAMTKAEIRKHILGINDYMITFSVMRLHDVIPWDYNEFNHVDNLALRASDKDVLMSIIKDHMKSHSGYCSDTLLYEEALKRCPEVLERNNVKTAQNLYYIAYYFFSKEFRFRRPHIVSADFPVQDLHVLNIARTLLRQKTRVKYEDFNNLAREVGWAIGTLYAVFSELEKDYIRISKNEYVHKDNFNLDSKTSQLLTKHLEKLIADNGGYCSFVGVDDYDEFPPFCDYQWNGFLLESVLTEYKTKFRIIYPQVIDRRSLRGIVVPMDSAYKTFEDLVVGVLKQNGIRTITDVELDKLLRRKGIITKLLPQEVFEFPSLNYKNEVFSVK